VERGESLEEYIKFLSPNTAKSYESDIKNFIEWFEGSNGDFSPEKITGFDLKDYVSYLANVKGLKNSSINRKMIALRSWLKYLKERNIISDIPKFPKYLQEVERSPKALDRNEINRLLRTIEREGKPKEKAIIALLFYAGLRVSEVANLKKSDIEISEKKGKVIIRHGKGNKFREVPLNNDARNFLKPYLETLGDTNWLFPGKNNKPITSRAIQQIIKKYAYLAKIPSLTPHTLRHTFATLLLRQGTDLVVVSNLLGHSRLDTTARYTKPSEKDLERAISILEDI